MNDKLSPMMRQYFELKKDYKDTFIFYRLGDFYEMFFDDAVEGSKLLDLTLTGRDCGLDERAPMCGVPHHAAEAYIAKLIKLGRKVAICEQMPTENQKGMMNREVVRVITRGTAISEEMLDASASNYLLSVHCQGDKAAGLAWIDLSTGDVNLLDLSDMFSLEDFILSLNAGEIICGGGTLPILNDFASVKQNRTAKPSPYYEYYYDADNAKNIVKEFYSVFSLEALGLNTNPLAVTALGGLLKYVSETQKQHLKHIMIPKIMRPSDRMFLDYSTIRNLELLETNTERSVKGSLLGVLDMTKTKMGARLIKKWILEPSRNTETINDRLDAVSALCKDDGFRVKVKTALSGIRDVERLCSKIAFGNINPREVLSIKDCLNLTVPLKSAVSVYADGYLKKLADRLNPLEGLATLISLAIDENAPISVKDGGVIKKGYNESLDKLREMKSSGNMRLAEYEAKEREKTGIRTLKVSYNRVFGYYIEISRANSSLVPFHYVRKQTLSGSERYTTEELKRMEDEILGAEEKILTLEESLYSDIRTALLDSVKQIHTNAKLIAEIDVLYSFSEISCLNNYTRPEINDGISGINIKEGRHPVIESLNADCFVPNDTVIDDRCLTLVITGPNMAGKSTYMRQTALIALMAHIGCFVPAKKAEISIVDRIFTRIGASDNLSYGQSTFMVEMIEAANILNNATDKSLLILDEIGRGTSTLDGLSIAFAIIEYIALKLKAKTMFATHFHELAELEEIVPNLKNYHFLIKETTDGIVFLYKLSRGGASKSFGIEVASLAGVDRKVIDRAKDIMTELEESHRVGIGGFTAKATEDAVPLSQIGFFQEDTSAKEISAILKDMDVEKLTAEEAVTVLTNLKNISTKKRRK